MVKLAFRKMNARQFSVKCMRCSEERMETVDSAQNQKEKSRMNIPAGTPVTFQMTPVRTDSIPLILGAES